MHAFTRRGFLRGGLAASLSLADILRLRAATRDATGQTTSDTAVIFVMLGGGASHIETFDPKPNAPAEYRGPCRPIATTVPGVHFCELLPRHAQLMRHLAIVRAVTHQEASHIALHMVETGYFLRNAANARNGEMPAIGCVVAKVRETNDALPRFVALPAAQAYSGPQYLGGRYAAFNVNADPSQPGFQVNNLSFLPALNRDRLQERRGLLNSFGGGRREDLYRDVGVSIDAFHEQAVDLLTGGRARDAFDLEREAVATRDRYGRNAFGQRLLLARRLVSVGVPFVMVRTFDWDDHMDLEPRMKGRCPEYDNGIAALVQDLLDRGMNKNVLVVAMGEFGRTPRVNVNAGRDHWPAVMSVMLSGGNYRMGQVIGASDSNGAAPRQAPYAPQSVLGMVYRHLGIDPGLTFPDHTGRPRHLLEEREPIRELI